MKIIFKNHGLKDLYENGYKSIESRKYNRGIIDSYRKKVFILESILNKIELKQYKSLRFEKLTNYKLGDYSIRVNDQYRVVFNILENGKIEILEIVELVDYH